MTVAPSATGGAPDAPIYLVAEPSDGTICFRVIGAPTMPFKGRFTLEIRSSSGQSRHEGSAHLQGGEQAVLSTMTVGVPDQSTWRAQLLVEPSGAAAYEQVLSSD